MSVSVKRSVARASAVVLVALAVIVPTVDTASAAAPTITSFSPTSGPVGTEVEISGSGFGGSTPVTSVTFNGVAATTFSVDSNVQITATVPAGATDGLIEVTNADGNATSPSSFDVTPAPVPTITSFTPTSGPVGTTVVITGTGFTGATAVTFNGVAASTFTVDSSTSITVTVPAGATDGPIAVTTPGGTATSPSSFDVTPSPVPTITSFNPTSGAAGSTVVLTGTGFTGATAVTFNGLTAVFTVNSDVQITATVPAGATTGPIAVTTPGGTATSSTDFTVTTAVEEHARTVTLSLRKHLVARGRVTVDDGFSACGTGVTVKVQRRRAGGGWATVGTDQTNSDGAYRERIRDRVGSYRAVAVREVVNGGADVCLKDRSPRRRHSH